MIKQMRKMIKKMAQIECVHETKVNYSYRSSFFQNKLLKYLNGGNILDVLMLVVEYMID